VSDDDGAGPVGRVAGDAAVLDVDHALRQPLPLSIGEADVLIVAERLVGRARADRFRAPPSTPSPSPTLRLAIARTLAVGSLAWLHDAGGAQPRTVLRRTDARGRAVRRTGTLTDAALNEGEGALSLACSQAALNFLWNLCTTVLPQATTTTTSRTTTTTTTTTESEALPNVDVPPPETTGDHVFFALAHSNLGRLALPARVEQSLASRLRRASPLAALLTPDASGPSTTDRSFVDVVGPGLVRVFECVEPAVTRAWGAAVRSAWENARHADELIARCVALHAAGRQWLQVIDEVGRTDLVAPVVALVTSLVTTLPPDPRSRLLRLPGVATMTDRDRVVAALADVANLAGALDDLRARLLAERYGDDRFEEARITLPLLDERVGPARAAHEAFVQRLTGGVG
jgi:hypothetical protein